MAAPRGTRVLIGILSLYLVFHLGREAFREEGPPAFFIERPQGIRVLLGAGFPAAGIHQFSDGITPLDVIRMTGLSDASFSHEISRSVIPLMSGEALKIFQNERQVFEIERTWMPAAQRMALGIPLHPDRMSPQDWEALPGIGPSLAERIESDRQRNGDFGSLKGLLRVKGIGPHRIKAWENFF